MPHSTTNPLLQAALAYAARGWSVFPAHGVVGGVCTCGGAARCSPGKHPRTTDGLHAATTDPVRIRGWWRRWPDSNLAIRTGKASRLVVLDIDGEEGEAELARLERRHAALPPTLQVRTGGGRHLLFYHPGEEVRCSVRRIGPGIDVRGNDGYIIAPPSRHARGVCYRWIPHDPGEDPPASLPVWLLALLRTPDSPTSGEQDQTVPQGRRNNYLFSLAAAMRRRGLAPEEIEPALQRVNERRCEPPLPEREVNGIAQSAGRYASREPTAGGPVALKLSAVEPRPLDWLWPGRIPAGKITLLAGDPGLGKSLLSLDIAARISSGTPWPDTLTPAPQGDVILLSAEDDPADTIRPRLDAAGADPDRITLLCAVQDRDGQRTFDIRRDVHVLEQCLRETGAHIVVVDPLSSYLGATDSHNNADVRAALAPLAEVVARHGVAVLAITHLRKAGGRAVHRMMGSLAFAAAARAVWIVENDESETGRALLLPVKSNLGPAPTGLAYVVRSTRAGPIVDWSPEPIPVGADGFPAQADSAVLQEAAGFLLLTLAQGPQAVQDIEREAQGAGISLATLRRARARLGIKPVKRGFRGPWFLELPKDASRP